MSKHASETDANSAEAERLSAARLSNCRAISCPTFLDVYLQLRETETFRLWSTTASQKRTVLGNNPRNSTRRISVADHVGVFYPHGSLSRLYNGETYIGRMISERGSCSNALLHCFWPASCSETRQLAVIRRGVTRTCSDWRISPSRTFFYQRLGR
jgi:hypothetical protein